MGRFWDIYFFESLYFTEKFKFSIYSFNVIFNLLYNFMTDYDGKIDFIQKNILNIVFVFEAFGK